MITTDSYVLVTAAYNEGKFIERTICSVVSQDLRPTKWIIISDGSTDDTDAIITRYADVYDFIKLHRIDQDHPRNFLAQVNAINAGIAILKKYKYDFIGNLDADITFESFYFSIILEKFRENPNLGLAGGTIYDKCSDGSFRNRKMNRVTSVAHAVQLFRRECFDALGGSYLPLPYGGPDTYAETDARRKGWQVTSLPDLKAFHHRPTGSAGGLLRGCFRQGRMDFSLGISPLFEGAKLLRRIASKPYMVGSLIRLAGFVFSWCCGEQRAVSKQFITYMRQEQMHRLVGVFKTKRNI